MIIGGFQKTSLIEYPGKISAIVFTQGCNFRCGYCHNPELIKTGDSSIEESSVFDFLKSRIGKLDAIVITGGEPTLQKGLIAFIKRVKEMGYLIKLDTNGTSPETILSLLEEKLIDYVAMDIKAPLNRYGDIVNTQTNPDLILQSVNLILNSNIGYEFRTTVVKSQLDIKDFEEIGKTIKGAKNYYLQEFIPSKTLNPEFLNEKSYSKEDFEEIKNLLNQYIKNVYLR